MVRILGIQGNFETGTVEANYERGYRLLEQGAELYRPDIIMLPEAFAGYLVMTESGHLAEDVPGATTDQFCAYSSRYGVLILFGMIRRNPSGGKPYNSAVIVDRGGIIGIYDKTHLVINRHPGAIDNEREMFTQGDHLGLFDTRFGRIGVLICHDGGYPEVWRSLVLEGARAIFWLISDGDMSAWARAQALWNATPVFSCNRVLTGSGDRAGRRVGGGSVFCDVLGEPFDLAGTTEGFVFAEVNLDELADYKVTGVRPWANVFRVRRPDLYESIVRPKTES